MTQRRHDPGFTLLELLVVIVILALLAGILVPRVSNRVAAARDAQRIQDIQLVRDAIERYYLAEGEYPSASPNPTCGNWDVSSDGDFIPALVAKGYLKEPAADPLNDDTYQYRYRVYSKGANGCVGETRYYVLGIRNFETARFKADTPGYFKCSGRDWSTQFAYVTGGGASYQ